MSHPAPPGWRLQSFGELGSTQDVAIDAARAADPGRLAILAGRQTAGRGSRGRGWTAPEGNLNLSVVLRPADALPEPGRWALMAGIALHDALRPHADGLKLKWPNDLLLNGAKLGGILIDSEVGAHGSLDWVVMGFGANLRFAPDLPGRAVACLADAVPAGSVADGVLVALDALDRETTGEICAAWLRRAHPVGTWLDVKLPQRALAGSFAGLTARGELLLDGQADPIGSGEVFVGAGNIAGAVLAPCC